MKNVLLALCLLAAGTGAEAQQIIKGEDIHHFGSVSFTGGMSVEMIRAEKPGLYMELHEVEPKNVTWNVDNGELAVKLRPSQKKEGALIVRVYYTDIGELTTNGADVIFKDTLRRDMFTASASAGAKVTATVDCGDFEMTVTGNSAAQLDGRAKYLTLEANQRSKIDARRLESVSARVRAVMYSEIYVWATERMVAETGTGSGVFYRGEPWLMRTKTRLGGNVNSIGR